MSLYETLLDKLNPIQDQEEKYLAADVAETTTDETAVAFLTWYKEEESQPWVYGLSITEIYNQFKMSL